MATQILIPSSTLCRLHEIGLPQRNDETGAGEYALGRVVNSVPEYVYHPISDEILEYYDVLVAQHSLPKSICMNRGEDAIWKVSVECGGKKLVHKNLHLVVALADSIINVHECLYPR